MCSYLKIAGFISIPIICLLNANPWPDLQPVTDADSYIVAVRDDIDPIPLPQMICLTEVIVLGTVNKISKGVLNLTVEDLMKGNLADDVLIIADYVPRKFSGGKPLPCKAGDKYIFFLLKEKEEGMEHDWNIFGWLGEGKLPVEDDFVYFPGLFLEGLEKKYYTVHGEMQYMNRQYLSDFTDAVSGYDECVTCEIIRTDGRQSTRYITDCEKSWVQEFSRRSWIHEYLIQTSGFKK